METKKELLFQEAQKQWVLRMSSTGMDGIYNLDPQLALEILSKYRDRLLEASFPSSKFWLLRSYSRKNEKKEDSC
jgi:hypothetical protein